MLDNNAFTYSDDVNVKYKITGIGRGVGISVFNSLMTLGKTTVVVDVDSAPNPSAGAVTAVRLKNGSVTVGPGTNDKVTAEFAAGSSFTVNGNGSTEITGLDIEAGHSATFIPEMTVTVNENTTVTLNRAGDYSVGLFAYLGGAKFITKDGLSINLNSDSAATMYGIRAQAITLGSGTPVLGGEVELNGTTEIHMLNGGDGTAGILAHVAGSKVSAQKAVTITNVTDDSTAALYGIFASAGEIDFADAANVTISGGSEYSAAIAASSAGSIAVTGANIDVDAGRAFYASGVDSTITGRAAQYTIDGNMLAANGGAINVSMADGSRFNGITSLGATPGTIDLAMDGSQSVWNMSGDSVLSTLSLNNGATLAYAPVAAGGAFTPKTLTVEGNYAGNGGVLMLNTVLGGDGSLTDRLIVNGDVEAGTTKVAVVNVGGTGEQTVDGIKIVEVQGTSIGTFEQQNRIVAGAYDYSVVKGASDENWYLTSKVTPVDPEGPEGPARPGGESALRPEFGSYLANNYAANTMFLTRLHDRLGETQYTDVLTGEQKVTSMWMRNVGGHMRFRDSSEQLRTKSNRYVLQLGGDLAQWSSDGLDRWHLGAMVGYGNDRSKTVSSVNSRDSKGQTTGYSAGLYGTWYANQADKSGAYLDSWVMYSRFDNKVMGEERETEKYKSRGVTASVEGGYSFKVGENEHKSYWIQPKAQVVWMGVNAKDHYEAAGVDGSRVKVSDDTDGNLMTRLGVRAYMKGHSAIDEGKDREFQPFIEANWIHNTQNYGVKMAGVKNEMSGTKNIGEVKIGVEGQLSKRLNLWGNAAQQVGDKGYSDTSAMVGVKYSF
ncbi:hypothetical protein SOASR030_15120 [Leminorella grimontii]|uniref:Autotransporter domain-containing protein n=1 Tax=Leminorella grimontii TaxID=82981 RepID=A0AAV5N1J7_9GAMM|nr:hypothetical protein SOASR030_15120 [Leminorella grimontii]